MMVLDLAHSFSLQVVNLENIVHAGLVTFQTHRINKDFSNAIKD